MREKPRHADQSSLIEATPVVTDSPSYLESLLEPAKIGQENPS